MIEKLIIEDSTPRNFISGGGKYMSLVMNMAYEVEKIMPTGVDRKTANDFFVDMALQFKSELKLSEETIRNYDPDLLPVKWKGDTYAITINIPAVAKALLNDKLQQNLSGTYKGEVLLIYGGKSQFKVGSDPLFLKHFPKLKKIEFEDAGHFIHNSYPQQFIQEVVYFINHGTPCQAKY
ncbi:protein ABHD11 [Trichonephila clavata]|uniref:Protein ABHD11 n=1 Tax=Trichonephila clavata TaxID=2740835 RepID=A0A8X6GF67_TRICU|nr:protein ABHD11 [Trichonephila clavata]